MYGSEHVWSFTMYMYAKVVEGHVKWIYGHTRVTYENLRKYSSLCDMVSIIATCYQICDLIWENLPFMHGNKYLEIPILIIWSIVTQEGKQIFSCNLPRFSTAAYNLSIHQLLSEYLAELPTILHSF